MAIQQQPQRQQGKPENQGVLQTTDVNVERNKKQNVSSDIKWGGSNKEKQGDTQDEIDEEDGGSTGRQQRSNEKPQDQKNVLNSPKKH